MPAKLNLKQGEAKTVTLTVTDQNGAAVDLSGATLLLGVKRNKADAAYAFSKTVFGTSQAAQGIVTVDLTATDTNQPPGDYIGELECSWAGSPETIEKTGDLVIEIHRSVIGADHG